MWLNLPLSLQPNIVPSPHNIIVQKGHCDLITWQIEDINRIYLSRICITHHTNQPIDLNGLLKGFFRSFISCAYKYKHRCSSNQYMYKSETHKAISSVDLMLTERRETTFDISITTTFFDRIE